MKTYFETPELRVIAFEAKDILTASNTDESNEGDHEELPGVPIIP